MKIGFQIGSIIESPTFLSLVLSFQTERCEEKQRPKEPQGHVRVKAVDESDGSRGTSAQCIAFLFS